MAKYMILYRSSVAPGDQMAGGTPEQMQASMEGWMKWAGAAGSQLVDLGSPVASVGAAGESAGTKTSHPIGGFSIVEADSVDAVHELLIGHPHYDAPDAGIEILEFLPIPGM